VVPGAHGDLIQIADHGVGADAPQGVTLPCSVEADDQRESAVARGLDASRVVGKDGASPRAARQLVCCLTQGVADVTVRREDAGVDAGFAQSPGQRLGAVQRGVEQHRVMAARVDGDRH